MSYPLKLITLATIYTHSLFIFIKAIVLARPIIHDKRFHEHPFTLLFKNDSFICNACGTNGKFVSYICPKSTCHLQVHKNCTSLPRIIKVTRHDHALVHKYFLNNGAQKKYDCGICFGEVKTEHGIYHCLRENCGYIVHVKCATQDENLYDVIDQNEELDEMNKATDSSITCVIEMNERGEAIKVKHFNHDHNLVLEDKTKEDGDSRQCDGCMLSISTPFYYCSKTECNFFLHKSCAELPKIKHHWFHRFPANLEANDFKKCDLCNRICSGLFYTSTTTQGDKFYFCLRGNAVLVESIIAVVHSDIQKNMSACEEGRNSNHWCYSCTICDNAVHVKCALGNYPFVKDGITWPYEDHDHTHNLSFSHKVDGYPYCSVCDELCQDDALKCKSCTCNYIIHLKCRRPRPRRRPPSEVYISSPRPLKLLQPRTRRLFHWGN
ncbi:hypothetical protein PTKIN_Ptkin13bG0201700 [Pterospermum kingtungense]